MLLLSRRRPIPGAVHFVHSRKINFFYMKIFKKLKMSKRKVIQSKLIDFSFSKTRKEEEEVVEGKLDEDSCSLSDEVAANLEDEVGEKSRPRNPSVSGEDDEEEESGDDEEEENLRDILDEAEFDVRVHMTQ